MAVMYYEQDCDFKRIKNKKIAVIGFGSQGHAHALNLHDSGADVTVGLYKGSKSWKKAEDLGLKVATAEDAGRLGRYHNDTHQRRKAGQALPRQH